MYYTIKENELYEVRVYASTPSNPINLDETRVQFQKLIGDAFAAQTTDEDHTTDVKKIAEQAGRIIADKNMCDRPFYRVEFSEKEFEVFREVAKSQEKFLVEFKCTIEDQLFEAAMEDAGEHARQPYDPSVYCTTGETGFKTTHGDKVAFRPNHNVVHSLRVAFISSHFIRFLKKYHPDTVNKSKAFLDPYLPFFSIAMLYTVLGRKNEVGWRKLSESVVKICGQVKLRMHNWLVSQGSQESQENFIKRVSNESIVDDYFQMMVWEKLAVLTDEETKILQKALIIINDYRLRRTHWTLWNDSVIVDYDKIIREKNPALHQQLIDLTYHNNDKDIREFYRWWPGAIIGHYEKYQQERQNEVGFKNKKEQFSHLKQIIQQVYVGVSDKPEELVKSEALVHELHIQTYYRFREASAEMFKGFCETSGLERQYLELSRELYLAIRFMGDPAYKGGKYLYSHHEETSQLKAKQYCTVMSMVHDADLSRCFDWGVQPHFDDIVNAVSPAYRAHAKTELVDIHQYLAELQVATGDVVLQRVLANGQFITHASHAYYAPHFIDCSNHPATCLFYLRSIQGAFGLYPKSPDLAAKLPKAKKLQLQRDNTFDIHFTTAAEAKQFVEVLTHAQELDKTDVESLQIAQHVVKGCAVAFYEKEIEGNLSFELATIPAVVSFAHELFEPGPFTCFKLLDTFEAALTVKKYTYNTSQKALDFETSFFEQVEHPIDNRLIPYQLDYKDRIIVALYEPCRYTQGIARRILPETGLTQDFKLIHPLPLLYQAPAIYGTGEIPARLPRDTKRSIRGTAKNSDAAKKMSFQVATLGQTTYYMPGSEPEAMGILVDIKKTNIKDQKYIFENDAMITSKWYVPDSPFSGNVVNVKNSVDILASYLPLNDLQAYLQENINVQIDFNEILLGPTKTSVVAFFIPTQQLKNQIIIICLYPYLRKKYGYDVPLLLMDGKLPPRLFTDKDLYEILLKLLTEIDKHDFRFHQTFAYHLGNPLGSEYERGRRYNDSEMWQRWIDKVVQHIDLLTSKKRALMLMGDWEKAATLKKNHFLNKQLEYSNLEAIYHAHKNNLIDFAIATMNSTEHYPAWINGLLNIIAKTDADDFNHILKRIVSQIHNKKIFKEQIKIEAFYPFHVWEILEDLKLNNILSPFATANKEDVKINAEDDYICRLTRLLNKGSKSLLKSTIFVQAQANNCDFFIYLIGKGVILPDAILEELKKINPSLIQKLIYRKENGPLLYAIKYLYEGNNEKLLSNIFHNKELLVKLINQTELGVWGGKSAFVLMSSDRKKFLGKDIEIIATLLESGITVRVCDYSLKFKNEDPISTMLHSSRLLAFALESLANNLSPSSSTSSSAPPLNDENSLLDHFLCLGILKFPKGLQIILTLIQRATEESLEVLKNFLCSKFLLDSAVIPKQSILNALTHKIAELENREIMQQKGAPLRQSDTLRNTPRSASEKQKDLIFGVDKKSHPGVPKKEKNLATVNNANLLTAKQKNLIQKNQSLPVPRPTSKRTLKVRF